ncbi:MAG: FKBP-type peptidyl-prolyl cis-trans isomerase [Pirellulales bacterium]
MNVRLILVVAAALAACPLFAQEKIPQANDMKTLRDKASYSFGMTMGTTLKKQGVEIDIALLVQGIRDATAGKTRLTEEQAMEAMQAFEKAMIAKQAEDSKRFLADNKLRPEVKTTESGLQYRVLQTGQGTRPKANDAVRVNYRASFINGEEFENNGKTPFTAPVNEVIPGWREALQLMPIGSKWQLFIPPDLAYGEHGAPPAIGPNTTLVFELELLGIAKPATAAPGKTPPVGANRQTAPPPKR